MKKYNVRNKINNNNAIYTNGGWYIIVHLPYTLRVGGLVPCLCLLSVCGVCRVCMYSCASGISSKCVLLLLATLNCL